MRLAVIAHGAGGRALDHCAFWGPRLSPDVALLCLGGNALRRGEPDGGAYFRDHLALRTELLHALEQVSAQSPDDFSASERVFIGYSQGATMGALALVEHIDFQHLLLIEGGGENWSVRRAQIWQQQGGREVFFACGTDGCRKNAAQAQQALRQAGLRVEFRHCPGVGHTYLGQVGEAARGALASWGYAAQDSAQVSSSGRLGPWSEGQIMALNE